ncbi:GatA Asp-tRNAAsn Glu-tRNAGln amidotransferase A subunit [Pyrenophora tritici-repentis]|nr:GatA Asp-tRNAAsn-Glu-tRNAGln amidotransferase A subunit and related amidase [Pyrenophora tritici-repentis]KAI0606952.1 GatA Asp-tRNAAsn-Glu-tRNAGln amidotransferase A subunit and related amidase [Pyrenophora tritici-repentis]KAI0619123.1 GatA Asp-tRNAAsn-Glu-tRNAGln amidotransferase A subunit and related amidase [Pyrenophora tritici-repentis]KAI1528303.1 GatA Asp-tRNAAsn Glu-tRNAGln amidotransferase A subunit [Pyrenophora tritici-repentis]KAI1529561.1 GatA Asp-tRNAAsn Glu-tRNAGln amidotransf
MHKWGRDYLDIIAFFRSTLAELHILGATRTQRAKSLLNTSTSSIASQIIQDGRHQRKSQSTTHASLDSQFQKPKETQTSKAPFNILEASIADHRQALNSGTTTSVDLVISYLNRIATYDIRLGLNAFTVFNSNVLSEAAASDLRRAQGLPPRPLEGIPYIIKDSYKVAGMSVTNGSPALKGLMSSGDSAIAGKLRDAGAVLIGKTNMPPMAAGGMQRGLYGRAESPYNEKYLTAAFSSGSSNGAATSVTSSMAAFGMGSETVSSGRSPASNNALVCYTPSKGLLSCRGLWPLYVTCDVPTPYARSMDDMLELLNVIATPDPDVTGDFIREQPHIQIPQPPELDYTTLRNPDFLRGKHIGVPKMYIGGHDTHPHAKHPSVSPSVIALWTNTAKTLESLGAKLTYTDFPLVTNYEDDSVSGEANNVVDCPKDWNVLERGLLIAQAWDAFLVSNADSVSGIKSLSDIKDPAMLFPKPENYIPDTFLEVRNWIAYASLPSLVQHGKSIHDTPGMSQALSALEAQRKRDLEDWMDELGLDILAFPTQGDVGLADLEFVAKSTRHSLQNGVKYSNGNRALRHLGVPTVTAVRGVGELLGDVTANLTSLPSPRDGDDGGLEVEVQVQGSFHSARSASQPSSIQIFADGEEVYNTPVDGQDFKITFQHKLERPEVLGWDLKPLPTKDIMAIVVATAAAGREGGADGDGRDHGSVATKEARLLWVPVH